MQRKGLFKVYKISSLAKFTFEQLGVETDMHTFRSASQNVFLLYLRCATARLLTFISHSVIHRGALTNGAGH